MKDFKEFLDYVERKVGKPIIPLNIKESEEISNTIGVRLRYFQVDVYNSNEVEQQSFYKHISKIIDIHKIVQ